MKRAGSWFLKSSEARLNKVLQPFELFVVVVNTSSNQVPDLARAARCRHAINIAITNRATADFNAACDE
jgi:hypothetical protein